MKKAFTMIELIMVMVVIGIVVAIALPRVNQDNIYQAANQVVSHIRYTQHLAMQDNKFDANNSQWFKSRWQILFHTNAANDGRFAYSIFSDVIGTNSGNPDANELAKNPSNPSKLLSAGFGGILNSGDSRITEELDLGKKFGILDMKFSGCFGRYGRRISFDNFGRPMRGDISNYTSEYDNNRLITQQCTISLCTENPCPADLSSDKRVDIVICHESGYAKICTKENKNDAGVCQNGCVEI